MEQYIIDKAKREFPRGTRFYAIDSIALTPCSSIYTASGNFNIEYNDYICANGNICIYKNGKYYWAKLVVPHKPEIEIY